MAKVKKLGVVLLVVAVGMALGACEFLEEDEIRDIIEDEEESIDVGVVFSVGGLGDYSFNDMAYGGLLRAAKDMNVEYEYIEPGDVEDFKPELQNFAEKDYDLVLAIGYLQEEAVKSVSQDNPDTDFAHIDVTYDSPPENVKAIEFAEDEGSFLAGSLAGYATETDKVGFIGGVDVPLINSFEEGFEQGAEYVNNEVEVYIDYVGDFRDIEKGEEIAEEFIEEKEADIIYHAAGGAGEGLFTAVEESEEAYAIGVDTNQNWIAPGNIIASMVKRVDEAVYNTIEDVVEGDFSGGEIQEYGLNEQSVGLTPLEAEVEEFIEPKLDVDEATAIKSMKEEMTAPHADDVENIKQDIIAGEIEITD